MAEQAPPSTAADPATDPHAASRDAIQRIFKFLIELEQIRKKPPASLRDHLWSQALAELPDHPAVRLELGDEEEGTGFRLHLGRPAVEPCPAPPDDLSLWLQSGWRNPLHDVQLRGPDEDEGPVPEAAAAQLLLWSPRRAAWAERERSAAQAQRLFDRAYEKVFKEVDRESESFELLLADGLMTGVDQKGRSIQHPILVQPLEISFDPITRSLEIVEGDGNPRLLGSLLRSMPGVEGESLQVAVRQVREQPPAVQSIDDVAPLLKGLVNRLFPTTGRYVGPSEPVPHRTSPNEVTLRSAPVLMFSKRKPGYGEAIERFLEGLAELEELPEGLRRVVGDHPAGSEPGADGESDGGGSDPLAGFDPVLTKPANRDQVAVLERLHTHGTVVVQGPPGTGKTHTIANLLGHLLAQGKSILVTAQSAKALRVVRQHLVEELQPLCVSVLGSDRDSRAELESAVNGIVQRFNHHDSESLQGSSGELARRRAHLRGQVEALQRELADACSREHKPLVLGGESKTPADLARWLRAHEQADGWIPGTIDPAAAAPLSQAELEDLYSTNESLPPDEEEAISLGLPDPEALTAPETLEEAWTALQEFDESEDEASADAWRPEEVEADDLAHAHAWVEELLGGLGELPGWTRGVVEAGLGAGAALAAWTAFAESVDRVAARAEELAGRAIEFAPESSLPWPIGEQLEVAKELQPSFDAGQAPGRFKLRFKPAWRAWFDGVLVNGERIASPESFAVALEYLRLREQREGLVTTWERLAPLVGAAALVEAGSGEPERPLGPPAWEVRRALEWADVGCSGVTDWLDAVGFDWRAVRDQQPPTGSATERLDRFVTTLRDVALPALNAAWREQSRSEYEAVLAEELPHIEAACRGADPTGVLSAIRGAAEERDVEGYRSALQRLEGLAHRAALSERRDDALGRLSAAAPSWAAAVRHRRGAHGAASAPGDIRAAWAWARWSALLTRHLALDPDAIQRRLSLAKSELQDVERTYAATSAWLSQAARTTEVQMQALTGWVDTVRRIGKGTGKRAPRLKREARRLLDSCRSTVPAWVMPMSRVVETYDLKETQFDVVVIDEASQLDVLGLVAFALGRQVVVVGDNEQVSPAAVGQDQTRVQALIDQYLAGVPNALLYEGRTSIYDLARQAFGGRIRLREHFRCARPIIEFSNQLCYEQAILPLRDTSRSTLLPHVVSERVTGWRNGKVNAQEALHVASLVAAMCRLDAYEECTVGVVSLLGFEQAQAIERLLSRHIDLVEIQERRIVCGTSAQFQGDERDVMVLSMVEQEPEGGVHRLQERAEYKQRLNVASSRARDQLWVVHSVDPGHFKAQDLRGRFLNYVKDPSAASRDLKRVEVKADSPFEIAVARDLVGRGFAVEPQFAVGAYRIDLVATGPDGSRVAIECDGERFHGPEKLQEDLERQGILERLGWRFIRIRGGAYYRDPKAEMNRVVERLDELGVGPGGRADPAAERTGVELLAQVRELAAQVRAEWAEAADGEGETAWEAESTNGDWVGASAQEPQGPDRRAGRARSVSRAGRGQPEPRPSGARPSSPPAGLGSSEERLLAAVDDTWRGRAELVERCAIASGDWLPTIKALLASGRVEKTGKKRGTKYRLASAAERGPAVGAPADRLADRLAEPPRPLARLPSGRIASVGGGSAEPSPRVAVVVPRRLEPKPIVPHKRNGPAPPIKSLSRALAHFLPNEDEVCPSCGEECGLILGTRGPYWQCSAPECARPRTVAGEQLSAFTDSVWGALHCRRCNGLLASDAPGAGMWLRCAQCDHRDTWQTVGTRLAGKDR